MKQNLLLTLSLGLNIVHGSLQSTLSCSSSSTSSSGPIYSVSLDGNPLFINSPALAVFMNGAWSSNSWVVTSAADVSGNDALGSYTGTECSYAVTTNPAVTLFTAAAYSYSTADAAPEASIVRFKYSFPQGASATNHSAAKQSTFSTVANFPAFKGGPNAPLPDILTWRDAFFGPSNNIQDTLGQIASTIVFFNGNDVAARAVVLSPLDVFLNAALGDDLGDGTACSGHDAGCWAGGVSATVTSLPPGFAQSYVLVSATGFTSTVNAWGSVLRAYYGGTSTRLSDVSLTTLGYQTDNGAQLCFGCDGPLDQCLLDEKTYLDSLNIPIKYLSFQNAWWEAGAESAPWCVGEWVPNPRKVPMGMQAFQQKLGLPLQLYAPYFCASSDYANNFSMVRSNTKLPGCNSMDFYDATPEESRTFYEFLFDLGQDYGMTMFEPDFLNANHVCVPRFIEEIGAADGFFSGQTGVALERGIPIQWCFCTPMLLMWTLSAPAVTNFRVSYDFYYGGSWDIGRSSLIVWAMGKAPSKDTFWTTSNGNQSTTRGGCDRTGCPPDHSTPAAELHTMLTVLSTGPVGFSDAPGETDPVLIMRTCDAAGNLLQPSKPLTACDSTHDSNANTAPTGYALVTHTSVSGGVWLHMIITHQLTKPFQLRQLDVWPAMTAGGSYAMTSWASLQACGATGGGACGVNVYSASSDPHVAVGPALPAVVNGTDPFVPTLTLVAPICSASSGVAVFGEVDKFATVSIQRFLGLACTSSGVSASLSGVPGESIRIAWWAPQRPGGAGVVFVNATFATGGTARVLKTCSLNADGTLSGC